MTRLLAWQAGLPLEEQKDSQGGQCQRGEQRCDNRRRGCQLVIPIMLLGQDGPAGKGGHTGLQRDH